MWLIQVCLGALLAGCSADSAPPHFDSEHRQIIKQNLQKLGAKVTAETAEEVYLSLRKTHVAVRELGGTIEGSFKTGRDIQDFGIANEAVAKGFLASGEFQEFKKWLHKALAPNAPSVLRSEYDQFKVTISRKPLLAVFTRKHAKAE